MLNAVPANSNRYFGLFVVLNVMDDYGNTPLHWATEKNQVESVKFLLSRGANPNLQNGHMMAPLHIAVQNTHNEVLKVWQLAGSHRAERCGVGTDLCPTALLCHNGQPERPG